MARTSISCLFLVDHLHYRPSIKAQTRLCHRLVPHRIPRHILPNFFNWVAVLAFVFHWDHSRLVLGMVCLQ